MFKNYKDICDVVSLLVYCPAERSYLVTKESNGEFWIPCSKCEKNSWKSTAHKIHFELLGMDTSSECHPLRIYKIWVPNHSKHCVYHAVYKVAIKTDVKKRAKLRAIIVNCTGRGHEITGVRLALSLPFSPDRHIFISIFVGIEGTSTHFINDVYTPTTEVVVFSRLRSREFIRLIPVCVKVNRNRLQWLSFVELERQRVHATLRSPELALFAQLAVGDPSKDNTVISPTVVSAFDRVDIVIQDMESGMIVEICEDNVLVGCEVASGAITSPHCHILQAAKYTRDDQVRLYREFLPRVFPALYMSPGVFTQFMVDAGWQQSHCLSLFRAADISNRGGLSFMETLLWTAALEPHTNHEGVTAEIRCRYIFRYFDSNRDGKLEYVELKELIGAGRTASGLTADSLSVAKDADMCLRQMGVSSAAPLALAEFLRWSSCSWAGAGALLRAPASRASRLRDLQERFQRSATTSKTSIDEEDESIRNEAPLARAHEGRPSGAYALATCAAHLRPTAAPEMQHLHTFDEDAVSASTARLVSLCVNSLERLGDNAIPSEAFAAVHYFATPIDKPVNRRMSGGGSISMSKGAYSWLLEGECASLGARLLRLAEALRPLCLRQPRLLTLSSPVYVIGDLHGNLAALLAMEAVLWPNGTALMPGDLLFLGDYVDRGPHGTELLTYLFAAKLQRPDSIHLIRGNHETREIQKMFTFYTECIEKYGEVEGLRIWNAVNDVFDVLPLAAIVDEKVFCCHGGIPPPWVCPLAAGVARVPAPLPRPDQSALAWELMWNDPVDESMAPAAVVLELGASEGFARNWRRGAGHVFSARALRRFLRHNRLHAVLRAHQLHAHGFMLQASGRLVSLFSSSRYCGGNNASAVALLQRDTMRMLRVDD